MSKASILLILILSILTFYIFYTPSLTPQQLNNLKNKVVVICGASSGIGEVTAYEYAKHGAQLVIVARRIQKLEKVKSTALGLGSPRVEIITHDFSLTNNAKHLVDKVMELYNRVDIVVLNHAAIPLGGWLEFENYQTEEYVQRTFQINTLSYIQLARYFTPHLEKTSGHYMVTSSISGECPLFDATLYSGTKFALNGFFYSLQQEFIAKKSNVSLTIVSFGLIMTDAMSTLFDSENIHDKLPNLMKGDLNESGEVIVKGSITRPRSVDYPRIAVKFARWMAFFNPWYHETMIQANGKSYEEITQLYRRLGEVSKKMGYQEGNQV